MARPNRTYQRIYKLIEEKGPMSQVDIVAVINDVNPITVTSTIRQARGMREGYEHTKTMYVKDWKPARERGGKPSPVIALGNLPDMEELVIDPRESRQRSWTAYNKKVSIKRANKKAQKKAAARVFEMMLSPPEPVEVKAVRVVRHQVQDDDEIPLGPSPSRRPYKRRAQPEQQAA